MIAALNWPEAVATCGTAAAFAVIIWAIARYGL